MPKVSVILPNFNHAAYLDRRFTSILNQTHTDFELLFLDNASTDASREVARRYASDPRVRLEFNEVNSGSPYLQWNKGLERTSGEYVWIAESDDYAEPTLLERLVPMLEGDSRIGLAGCDSWNVDQDDRLERRYSDCLRSHVAFAGYDFSNWDRAFTMNGREYCARYMYPWNTLPNASAIVFRRAALESIGGPVLDMKLCADWKTYCKIFMRYDVAHVPDALNYFRQHVQNVRTRTKAVEFLRETLRVQEYLVDELKLDPSRSRAVIVEFVAQGLLARERRPPSNKVPLRRCIDVLRDARSLRGDIFGRTARIVAKELASDLAARTGLRKPRNQGAAAAPEDSRS